jgi:hypothetical protein
MLLSRVLKNMLVGTTVIYYSSAQRAIFKNDEELFKQSTRLGTVKLGLGPDGNYVITPSGFSLTSETVPEKYVRTARQVQWYEFWKSKGYWKSGWFYVLFVIFFLLFVK